MYLKKRLNAGFTLVEVMVVLVIIAILMSIIMASISKSRANARDKKRLTDLAQIELALKLYYDQNGVYPQESAGFSGGANVGMICKSCSGPINGVIDQFLGSIPEDPLHDGSNYYYYYDGYHRCSTGDLQATLFAYTMENGGNKNESTYGCGNWGTEGGATKANAHVKLYGPNPL